MNPAPTLLADYMTSALMWAVIATAAIGFVVYRVTKRLKTAWRAKSAELDQVLKDGPTAYDDTCGIDECHRPGPGLIRFNLPDGVLFVCQHHSWLVSQWVGRSNAVYDQDLDSTDLATWDQEMPA